MVLKSNKDYVFINTKGEECQVGDIQSADANKIMRYECKVNNIGLVGWKMEKF